MTGIYVALGSNLGDRGANLRRAGELLPPEATIEEMSAVYESMPQPPAPPPRYFNAVCRVATALSPDQLLAHLKRIEHRMGRRPSGYWAPRVIDLDLILYNDEVVCTPSLTVPHPRLTERAFVLKPLLDIDPALRHPETGQPLATLLGDTDVARVLVMVKIE